MPGLLGGILEAQTKPVLAWAAYTRAAPHEPRAKAALQRLSAQSLEISGERYFSPPPWTVLSLSVANASLLNPVNGVRADIALLRQTPSAQALQASFPDSARTALEAALRANMGESWSERVGNFLRTQVGVRSLTPRDGPDPDAILSRAEAALTA
ncbi:hypothetical protein JZU56_01410, partial [bacterium]|nr:hypothetical protein [bacterium]